ncbi:MAG: class I SAM-dependent methyltransferase [Actinomycetota bacterium]
MTAAEYLARPDPHLDPVVAAAYDDPSDARFGHEAVGATVDVLADLSGGGVAVEFAIGTGRIALPLAAAGVGVLGIDFSEPMVAELMAKPGADLVSVTIGDMTQTRVCSDAALVYLIYNTVTNLRTQREQVACFRNAAAHLAPGGRFVVENQVPRLRQLPPGETIAPFDVSPHHLGFDEYVDLVDQISVSHHYHIDGDRVRTTSPAFRYVWPSELDLMAELAGMEIESRWADWHRSPFTGESHAHVSVWRKP